MRRALALALTLSAIGCGLVLGIDDLPLPSSVEAPIAAASATASDATLGDVTTSDADADVAIGADASDASDAGDTGPVLYPSCRDLHQAQPTLPSGEYVIDVGTQPPFKAYCEMDYQGGGWTLIERFVGTSNVGPGKLAAQDAGREVLLSDPTEAYMPYDRMSVLVATATQVHIRTPYGYDAGADAGPGLHWLTSRADAGAAVRVGSTPYPIFNLQRGKSLSANQFPLSQNWSPQSQLWDGPAADVSATETSCSGTTTQTAMYPAIYEACGNTHGFHVRGAQVIWDWENPTWVPLQIYVR